LYHAWELPLFRNITASEAAHTAAVERLLTQSGVADPAAGMPPGSFSDPALQELCDHLLALALTSLEDALQAGALVEEVDIQDLTTRLAQTANVQIEQGYTNLIPGSENRPQYSARSGDAYSAQVLASGQLSWLPRAGAGAAGIRTVHNGSRPGAAVMQTQRAA
jgi:hypothetical protein